MRQPKIVFAFGAHPGADPKKDPGERDYFEMALRRAIQTAGYEDRKVTVLFEFKCIIEPEQYFSAEKARRITAIKNWTNSAVRNKIKQELEAGFYPTYDWFDWGCAPVIVEANSQKPGNVLVETERTTDRIIENTVFEMGYESKGEVIEPEMARETNIIRHAIISSHLRAREVAAMINAIETPDSLVFVPRGFAHKNMVAKFGSEYEVEEIEGSGCVPRFQSEAIMLSYKRRITDEELDTFALFKIICQRYLDSRELLNKKAELTRKHGDQVAYREIMKEAKDLTHSWIAANYALALPVE